MKGITIKDNPQEGENTTKKDMVQKNITLNKAVISQIEKIIGKKADEEKGYHDLDTLCGIWSIQESIAFSKALNVQRTYDEDLLN